MNTRKDKKALNKREKLKQVSYGTGEILISLTIVAGGGVGGAAVGAVVGSSVPVIGTAAGAGIGAAIGLGIAEPFAKPYFRHGIANIKSGLGFFKHHKNNMDNSDDYDNRDKFALRNVK